jgi:hypothetical protein
LHTPSSRTYSRPRLFAGSAGLALLLLMAAGFVAARPVQADTTITVDTLQDGNLDTGATSCKSAAAAERCTLRAALELNEAGGGGGTVTLGVPGQLSLTLGQVLLEKNVTITGAGAATSTVAGDGKQRVFGIDTGAVVTMSGFTIQGGMAGATPDVPIGGGILNFGGLTLAKVNVQSNTAAAGGGIADFGTLNVTSGILMSNTAQDLGGNLLVGSISIDGFMGHGVTTVSGATLSKGTAPIGGGAVVDVGASATFTQTTFAGNTAEADGGGVGGAVANGCGSLTLTNDTLDRNVATDGAGAAIFQACGDNLDTVSTAAGRDSNPRTWLRPVISAAQLRPLLPSTPAGVASTPTPMPTPTPSPAPLHADASLDFVTMAENAVGPGHGGGAGAGIFNEGNLSTINVHDTILANQAGGQNCFTSASATTISQGWNLLDVNDCSFSQPGDQTANPQLGPLADNGGPSQTIALTAGTPAVDAADPHCDVKTDQRGVTRPQGRACDIGAFELQMATPATPTALPSPPVTGQGRAPRDPSLVALLLALIAIPVVGIGVLMARARAA